MKRFYFSLLLSFALFACQDPASDFVPSMDPPAFQPNNADFVEFTGIIQTSSTDWHIAPDGISHIIEFDLADYPFAKKIIFQPTLRTISDENLIYAELYNLDTEVAIPGTQLTSRSLDYQFVESDNLFDHFPSGKVRLAVRIRSEKEGLGVTTGYTSYLVLTRE